jgi:hypothetical protein
MNANGRRQGTLHGDHSAPPIEVDCAIAQLLAACATSQLAITAKCRSVSRAALLSSNPSGGKQKRIRIDPRESERKRRRKKKKMEKGTGEMRDKEDGGRRSSRESASLAKGPRGQNAGQVRRDEEVPLHNKEKKPTLSSPGRGSSVLVREQTRAR